MNSPSVKVLGHRPKTLVRRIGAAPLCGAPALYVLETVHPFHVGASGISRAPIFYKSQSTLILLLLLSKSQPLTLDYDLVRYGAAERPQNGFLFQKEGHDIRRVPLFPSMCQHHMFRFCLVIRIILLFAGIAPDRSPTIGRRPVPGKFPLTKPDSR